MSGNNIQHVQDSVDRTRNAVLPRADQKGAPALDAYDQAVAKAVQSIAQSAAVTVQDATDMMRNIATVEVTAVGAATAKWIADPSDPLYVEIINKSLETIREAAVIYERIGQKAASVLKEFQQSPAKTDTAA